MNAHRRRFESFDKLSMYVIGVLVTALMGSLVYSSNRQVDLADEQVTLTRSLSEESIKTRISLGKVTSQITDVKANQVIVQQNQASLQRSVGVIKVNLVRLCERFRNNKDGEC